VPIGLVPWMGWRILLLLSVLQVSSISALLIVLVLIDFQSDTGIERCKGSNYYLILYFLRILFKFILCVLTLLTGKIDETSRKSAGSMFFLLFF
jgi:hypothetical protein